MLQAEGISVGVFKRLYYGKAETYSLVESLHDIWRGLHGHRAPEKYRSGKSAPVRDIRFALFDSRSQIQRALAVASSIIGYCWRILKQVRTVLLLAYPDLAPPQDTKMRLIEVRAHSVARIFGEHEPLSHVPCTYDTHTYVHKMAMLRGNQ